MNHLGSSISLLIIVGQCNGIKFPYRIITFKDTRGIFPSNCRTRFVRFAFQNPQIWFASSAAFWCCVLVCVLVSFATTSLAVLAFWNCVLVRVRFSFPKSDFNLCDTLAWKLIFITKSATVSQKRILRFELAFWNCVLIHLILRFGLTSRNPVAFWACVLACVLDSVILRSGFNRFIDSCKGQDWLNRRTAALSLCFGTT